MIGIHNTVRPLFITAGWYPNRKARLLSTIPADHPAADILAQFGGLRVGATGSGQE